MIKTKKIAFAIIIFLVFISVGCNKKEIEIESTPVLTPTPTETEKPEEIAVPKNGGTLNVSMRLPKTLNPLLNEDASVDSILKLIFLPLSTLDENLKPIANDEFVESIVFAEDGMSATIKIKEGKVWSDGADIKASDIVFSINTIKNAPENTIYKDNIKNILSCEAIDRHNAKINFLSPYSGMMYLLNFPIIPEHYYKEAGSADSDKNMTPIGNGPFVFDYYEPQRNIKLTANDRANKKRPYIDGVDVHILSDVVTDFYSFDRGLIDLIYGNVFESGKYLASKEYNVTEELSTYFDFIGFNFKKSIFQKKEIREAIAYTINYDDMISEVYVNYAKKSPTPISPKSWLYYDEIIVREYNIEKAKNILAEAEINESLLNIKILVNKENEERMKIASILEENLDRIGFNTEINAVSFDEYEALLKDRDYDIFIGGYNLSVLPNISFMLSSTNANGGTNIFEYKSEDMDKYIQNANKALTEKEYKLAMAELQKYIVEDLPCIGIAFRESAVIMNKNISGEINPSIDNIYTNVADWFFKN